MSKNSGSYISHKARVCLDPHPQIIVGFTQIGNVLENATQEKLKTLYRIICIY